RILDSFQRNRARERLSAGSDPMPQRAQLAVQNAADADSSLEGRIGPRSRAFTSGRIFLDLHVFLLHVTSSAAKGERSSLGAAAVGSFAGWRILRFAMWSGPVARKSAAQISAWSRRSFWLSAVRGSKQRIEKEAAPATDRGGSDFRENEALPKRRRDRVVDGEAEPSTEAPDKDPAAHVCADDRDRVDFGACDGAGHVGDLTFCNFRKCEVVLKI